MNPTFRTDLTCSREEQQGVVFYRIDDPNTQTSFRLYEIEYLIAKKLDGSRPLTEVIGAVKGEFNFDISEPDLQRFVSQLESMGFLVLGSAGETGGNEDETQTAVMPQPTAAAPAAVALDLLDEPDGAGPNDADRAELDRLLKSAFMHVKQGYLVHARDYFLAAKELNPTDEGLTKIVNHLEILGEATGPKEVEFLWNQAQEFFPEIAEEVGPYDAANSPASLTGEPEDDGISLGWEDDIKSRVVWTLILLALVAVISGGVYTVVQFRHKIFGSAAMVRVDALRAERIPIYEERPATGVQPGQQKWLSVGEEGKVARLGVKVGATVKAGDVLLVLELPAKVRKMLSKAEKALKKATAAQEKAVKKLEKLLAEREAVETERAAAEEQLKELRPKSVLKQGGVSKRDLEKWKTIKVEANKKLTRLAKKERGPRKQENKARAKRDAASKKLEELQARIGGKLIRAPFSGNIVEIKTGKVERVKPGDPLILIRDPSSVELTFGLSKPPKIQQGGEVHVAVARGNASRAKLTSVEAKAGGVQVKVALSDPSGGFADLNPKEFKLVREFAEPAFRVSATAVVDSDAGSHIFVVLQDRAIQRDIEVLNRDPATVVFRDRTGTVRDGEKIVAGRVDEGVVAQIEDGSSLQIGDK